MEYHDGDLEIGPGPGFGCPVVVRSRVGEARLITRFPRDEMVLESMLKDVRIALQQSLQPLRRALSSGELHTQTMLSSGNKPERRRSGFLPITNT